MSGLFVFAAVSLFLGGLIRVFSDAGDMPTGEFVVYIIGFTIQFVPLVIGAVLL